METISLDDVTPAELEALAAAAQERLPQAVNDLHRIVIVAEVLADWYRARVEGTSLSAVFREEGWGPALAEPDLASLADPSSTIEAAGVLGVYAWLSGHPHLNVLFVNDLAQEIHGIDAVAQDSRTGEILIIECKGTTRPISGGPRSYLGKTKRSGRQLSRRWCWSSLLDCAAYAPTAPIFLRTYGHFLMEHFTRLLIVSGVRETPNGFVPSSLQRAFGEADISDALAGEDDHDLEQQKRWLAEIPS